MSTATKRTDQQFGRLPTSSRSLGPIDLTEQRFGRLVAEECVGRDRGGNAVWLCRCDCGQWKNVSANRLRAKKKPTRSCGCLREDLYASAVLYDRTCVECGQSFRGHPGSRFCSPECRGIA